MKRCVCVATVSLVAILCLDGSAARAQAGAPAATPAGQETKAFLSVSGGPTLGNKSAGFVAIEIGWRLRRAGVSSVAGAAHSRARAAANVPGSGARRLLRAH